MGTFSLFPYLFPVGPVPLQNSTKRPLCEPRRSMSPGFLSQWACFAFMREQRPGPPKPWPDLTVSPAPGLRLPALLCRPPPPPPPRPGLQPASITALTQGLGSKANNKTFLIFLPSFLNFLLWKNIPLIQLTLFKEQIFTFCAWRYQVVITI